MHAASPAPSEHFSSLLDRLPPGLDVEALARETKAFQRPRGVRSGTDLLRLALAWACSGHSMQNLAAWAGAHGIARLTDEALVQRLHRAVPFLEALSRRLLAQVGEIPSWHGRVLRIADSTSLSRQASTGTDWRVHGVFDLGRGGFSHLQITDRHGAEALDRGAAVAGEIRIADRGYANAQAWQRFLQSRDGQADFIVRMRWNTIRLLGRDGAVFDLIGWLDSRPATSETHAITLLAQSGTRQTPLPIRLIARRKSPEAIARTHAVLRRQASRKQTQTDPRSYIAAQYIILATSLPAEDFPDDAVLAVYRLRWQIELAFKRLKSLIRIDEIRTRTEAGTRCWLYAHLILALLCEDLCQDFLDSFPSGPRRGRQNQFALAHDAPGDRGGPLGHRPGADTRHAETAVSDPP